MPSRVAFLRETASEANGDAVAFLREGGIGTQAPSAPGGLYGAAHLPEGYALSGGKR